MMASRRALPVEFFVIVVVKYGGNGPGIKNYHPDSHMQQEVMNVSF